ncbi:MAG: hypothetical protein ACLFMY_07430 [Guyparkeria sp.]|uniref:hypothetical protein n=1 Tax=Guyparkeria sp. TaxID=2035736 RepID=UPI00397B348D
MTIPSYFLSPEWAIIATQLLAGLVALVLVLAWALHRRHRHQVAAARRIIEDRGAIRRAGEAVLERQLARHHPGLPLPADLRAAYGDRSLKLLEPLVAAWLEPTQHDLSEVMRRLLEIRQEDLDEWLASSAFTERGNPPLSPDSLRRLGELADSPDQFARLAGDRQAARLAEALWLIEALDAGEDAETARRQAAERLRAVTDRAADSA